MLPPDINYWVIVAILGLLVGIIRLWYTRKKDIESKKERVRELQPKIKIENVDFRLDERNQYQVKVKLVNFGGGPARGVVVSIDGSNVRSQPYEIRGIKGFETAIRSSIEVSFNIPIGEDIFQKRWEGNKPKLYVSFHDKWFPDIEYPVISTEIEQIQQPPNELYQFMPRWDTREQNPPYENTFYSNYSTKQIKKIWAEELL